MCVRFFLLVLLIATSFGYAQEKVTFADDPSLVDTAHSVAMGQSLQILDLDLFADRQSITLRRFQVWADGAKIYVNGENGTTTMAPPPHAYFVGSIDSVDGSRAFVTFGADGEVRGMVSYGGRHFMLGADQTGMYTLEADVSDTAAEAKSFQCDLDSLANQGEAPGVNRRPLGSAPSGADGATGTYTVIVAVETDYEYYQRFGSVSGATDYIGDLLGYISGIYQDEVDTNLVVGDVTIWSTSSDPYSATSSGCALYEFGGYWNANKTGTSRTIAHMMSGKSTGGGVAWVGVLCQGAFNYNSGTCGLNPQIGSYGGDYGYTGGITGSFNPGSPAPVWDVVAVAHEIGHNFNSPHTHCYEGIGGSASPIDECYGSQSGASCYSGSTSLPCGMAGAGCGTIMSYCHLLSGGLSNISLTLGDGHPHGVQPERVPTRMNDHVVSVAGSNPDCLSTGCTPPNVIDISPNRNRCTGDDVVFEVEATGSGLTYQWRFEGVDIPGETGQTMTLVDIGLPDEGMYSCTVSNLCGSDTSINSNLEVYRANTIQSQSGDASICEGESVIFEVSAIGDASIAYQWRLDGVNLDGENSPSITINNASLADAGNYTCRITSDWCSSATTTPITLEITTLNITEHPGNYIKCEGQTANFSVAANGQGTLTYQWYKDNVLIPGATLSTLSLIGLTTGDAGDYHCEISADCGSTTTNTGFLVVNPDTAILSQPVDAVRCLGDNVTFSVNVSGDNLTYQWQLDNLDIPGATNSSHTISGVTAGDEGDYRCVVDGTCGDATSVSATLTISADTLGVDASQSTTTQGVQPVVLDATITCGDGATIEWINLNTATSYGVNVNPVVILDMLTEPTMFEVTVDNGTRAAVSDQVMVMASGNATYRDLNNDGCNDINDLLSILDAWRTSIPEDADGDGLITVKDFLYINITDGCPAQ